jgi:hypothetical protein
MTHEEHKARHVNLHHSFDELLADWIENGGLERPYPSEHTILELIEWSYRQTLNPTPGKDKQ